MGVLVVLGVLPATAPLIGQSPESAVEDSGAILAAESSLVVVPLHVYKNRKSVVGLGEQAFELVEDGVVQDLAFVDGPVGRRDPARGRTVPIEIILLVDVRHTVRIDLLDIRKIRNSFFEGVQDNVSISVYGFGDNLKRITGPTRDIAKVQIALEMAYSSGDGHIPVLDALVATARDAASRAGNASRKLVLLSGDLNARSSGAIPHSALDFEIPVYDVWLSHQAPSTMGGRVASLRATPLLLGHQGPGAKGAPQKQLDNRNQKQRTAPLHECCPLGMELSREEKQMGLDASERTSGHRSDWKHRQNMTVRAYLKSIAKVAQNEYLVGYYPSRKGDEPVARQVEVRLKAKGIGQLYDGRRVIVH